MGEKKKQPLAWMTGAIYLSIAAFIAKGLSALYKVPYQNLTGDIGFYIYQQVYPLYGVVFVLGTYGFPLVISKILVEREEAPLEKRNRLITLTIALFIINGMIGTSIIIFAAKIAEWMGDMNLTQAIRWLGAPFFLIPFLAVGRGFFQSRGNMIPTSISQVLEQFVRVAAILLVAFIAMTISTPYEAGISAGVGAFAGGIAGMIVMLLYLRKEVNLASLWRESYTLPRNWLHDVKDLYVNGFLVSISAMTLVAFQMIDSFSLFRLLLNGGWGGEEAAILKGIYDRGWPMIQLGAVVTTVFSYASIPYLTKVMKNGKHEEVSRLIKQSVKVCLVFGGAAALGLILIMPHLNVMLFTDNMEVGALSILSTSVFSGALFMTIAALLHGIGQAKIAAYLLLVGLIVKGLGNLVAVPSLHIIGAALSTSISLLAISILASYLLKKVVNCSFFQMNFWLKWVMSLIGMSLGVIVFEKIWLFFIDLGSITVTRSLHSVIAISSSLVGVFIFIILIWKLQLFTKREWEEFPKISTFLPYKN